MGASPANLTASDYELLLRPRFAFLENQFGFKFAEVKETTDHGEASFTGRYRSLDSRIDISWSHPEESIGILIRLKDNRLDLSERYIHLEPFIEFVSGGEMEPVVRPIYQGMSLPEIEDTMESRRRAFQAGVPAVLDELARRLQEYWPRILRASSDTVRSYHQWYRERGLNAK